MTEIDDFDEDDDAKAMDDMARRHPDCQITDLSLAVDDNTPGFRVVLGEDLSQHAGTLAKLFCAHYQLPDVRDAVLKTLHQFELPMVDDLIAATQYEGSPGELATALCTGQEAEWRMLLAVSTLLFSEPQSQLFSASVPVAIFNTVLSDEDFHEAADLVKKGAVLEGTAKGERLEDYRQRTRGALHLQTGCYPVGVNAIFDGIDDSLGFLGAVAPEIDVLNVFEQIGSANALEFGDFSSSCDVLEKLSKPSRP